MVIINLNFFHMFTIYLHFMIYEFSIPLPIYISEFIFRMLVVTNNRSNHGFNDLGIKFSDINKISRSRRLLAGLVV